jgi:hypothetical protein
VRTPTAEVAPTAAGADTVRWFVRSAARCRCALLVLVITELNTLATHEQHTLPVQEFFSC